MHLKLVCFAVLLLKTTVTAQSVSTDPQMTQAMLAEVRQLRQDLQNAAATIQRVQIAMYRLQAEAALLDRATQRVEQARAGCTGAQWQRETITTEIEQTEARKRNSQSSSDHSAAEQQLSHLKSSLERLASREQQCQIEQADAETQFRTEQAKMNDLQDQLDKLDKSLAGFSRK